MKDLKKLVSSIMAVSIIGTFAMMPLSTSAETQSVPIIPEGDSYGTLIDGDMECLGTDNNGEKVWVKISSLQVGDVIESLNMKLMGYDLDGHTVWGPLNSEISYLDKETGLAVVTIDGVPMYKLEGGNPTIGNSSTIGDSTTLGDSDYYQQFIDAEPTNIRGDINYDGKVNSADILFLRRYLLHLLKW